MDIRAKWTERWNRWIATGLGGGTGVSGQGRGGPGGGWGDIFVGRHRPGGQRLGLGIQEAVAGVGWRHRSWVEALKVDLGATCFPGRRNKAQVVDGHFQAQEVEVFIVHVCGSLLVRNIHNHRKQFRVYHVFLWNSYW